MVKNLHSQFMNVVNELVKKKIKEESIQVVILGGSVARGDETEYSDIDIVFYVKKKDMPKDPKRWYKFKGKYIEEWYSEIEKLNPKSILPEEKILYDKTEKIPKPIFDEKFAKKDFLEDLELARKSQKNAEREFEKENYDNTFNFLFGVQSPSFLMMHAIPPRFNFPFPSFRLLKSMKTIDKKHKTKCYDKITKLYAFNKRDYKKTLREFRKAYLLMGKIKKSESAKKSNLGFFEKSKIEFNLYGLKKTFENYPFVFAYRFIIGCLSIWSFDEKLKKKEKEIFYRILLKVLGAEKIDKKLIEEKLKLSKELLAEAEKLK